MTIVFSGSVSGIFVVLMAPAIEELVNFADAKDTTPEFVVREALLEALAMPCLVKTVIDSSRNLGVDLKSQVFADIVWGDGVFVRLTQGLLGDFVDLASAHGISAECLARELTSVFLVRHAAMTEAVRTQRKAADRESKQPEK